MDTTTILSNDHVEAVFNECLFQEGENRTDTIHVEAEHFTLSAVDFHIKGIENHRKEIAIMLSELSDKLKDSGGGGDSFNEVCCDRHGRQWTGWVPIMEQLVLLGIAIGQIEFCSERGSWAFPRYGDASPFLVINQ